MQRAVLRLHGLLRWWLQKDKIGPARAEQLCFHNPRPIRSDPLKPKRPETGGFVAVALPFFFLSFFRWWILGSSRQSPPLLDRHLHTCIDSSRHTAKKYIHKYLALDCLVAVQSRENVSHAHNYSPERPVPFFFFFFFLI